MTDDFDVEFAELERLRARVFAAAAASRPAVLVRLLQAQPLAPIYDTLAASRAPQIPEPGKRRWFRKHHQWGGRNQPK